MTALPAKNGKWIVAQLQLEGGAITVRTLAERACDEGKGDLTPDIRLLIDTMILFEDDTAAEPTLALCGYGGVGDDESPKPPPAAPPAPAPAPPAPQPAPLPLAASVARVGTVLPPPSALPAPRLPPPPRSASIPASPELTQGLALAFRRGRPWLPRILQLAKQEEQAEATAAKVRAKVAAEMATIVSNIEQGIMPPKVGVSRASGWNQRSATVPKGTIIPGSDTEKILTLVRAQGPMRGVEIAAALGKPTRNVSARVSVMLQRGLLERDGESRYSAKGVAS